MYVNIKELDSTPVKPDEVPYNVCLMHHSVSALRSIIRSFQQQFSNVSILLFRTTYFSSGFQAKRQISLF